VNPIAQLSPPLMFEQAAHPKLAPPAPTVRSESRSAANREGEFQQPARLFYQQTIFPVSSNQPPLPPPRGRPLPAHRWRCQRLQP